MRSPQPWGLTILEQQEQLNIKAFPTAWGLTGRMIEYAANDSAFPMHVGINREEEYQKIDAECVPHARGD